MSSLVWIELNSQAPNHNLNELRKSAKKGVLFCAVVKSNAYGHGMPQIVELLPSADWFAVNSLEEGIELRKLGVKKPVLLLGHVPLSRVHRAIESDLRLTVYNYESLKALSRIKSIKRPIPIHMEVESGTSRQGVLLKDIKDFIKTMQSSEIFLLEGISTHFANIEDTLNHEYAEKQLAIFQEALNRVRDQDEDPPIIHTACTAAVILFPRTHFNMLRAGIGIYGLWPSRETYLSTIMGKLYVPDLKPVLSWKTRIAQLKTIPEGSYVGYGCAFKTCRETKLAVLPVGYSDGYDRKMGNTSYVLINGRRAPVIGRVCMNLMMIDVTDIPDVKLEDEVTLLGKNGDEVISAESMAEWTGTINYEIVTRISPLLERKIV